MEKTAAFGIRRYTLWAGPVLALVLMAFGGQVAQAAEFGDTLEVRGLYKMESYFRLAGGSRKLFNAATGTFYTESNDVLMSQRNEFRLNIEWTPKTQNWADWIPPLRFVAQLRPWYDTDWLISTSGQGKYHKALGPFWENNLQGLREDNDPLFREYYVDITPPHFFFRLGRQIIAWGKSDGVYMLDILNPFNLRNPTIFEEENIKIPTWAANLNWQPTATGNLQIIYMPQYFHHNWAGLRLEGGLPQEGRYHDWTYKIVGYFNDFYNGEFGFTVPVSVHKPSTRPANSIVGARWSDRKYGVNYTLNYLYTFTPGLIDFADTGNFLTVTKVDRRPHRMHVAGFSADYNFDIGNPWLDGTVWRIETSETVGDEYYQGTIGNPRYTSHWGVLMGLDKTVLSDYLERPVFASFQYWHDLVTNQSRCSALLFGPRVCGPKETEYQDLGFNSFSRRGLRGRYKSLITGYFYKTFLQGDTVATELFALYELQFHDWWIRPKVTYRYNDRTTVALGFNIFAGSSETPYGQWTNNSNGFIELRRLLF